MLDARFHTARRRTRIAVPKAVGAVVQARVRRFLAGTAAGYAATSGRRCWLDAGAKLEPATIYDVNGLSSTALEELADMILNNSATPALYVRLPNGTAGSFTQVSTETERSPLPARNMKRTPPERR